MDDSNSDQGKGGSYSGQGSTSFRNSSSGLPGSPPNFQHTAAAYLQQHVEELHFILAPGLGLVPHQLHQNYRQDEKHGELGWGPGPGSRCPHTGLSPATQCLALNMCVSHTEWKTQLSQRGNEAQEFLRILAPHLVHGAGPTPAFQPRPHTPTAPWVGIEVGEGHGVIGPTCELP